MGSTQCDDSYPGENVAMMKVIQGAVIIKCNAPIHSCISTERIMILVVWSIQKQHLENI